MASQYPALESLIEVTPDFPLPGILFRDISPLLAKKFNATILAFASLFTSAEINAIDAFVGIDARGYILAAGLAEHFQKNMVIIRKGGKLPPPHFKIEYDLEYGSASFEMKPGSGNVIILDDVIATGGTTRAAADLCLRAGYNVKGFGALIDLKSLNNFEWRGLNVKSLFQYAKE